VSKKLAAKVVKEVLAGTPPPPAPAENQ
jgi:hypothetical protein